MQRIDPELPITDITHDAIIAFLEKFPRKKPVFKEFCHDYNIVEMDEFTEVLGLEILEILDSKTYIQTIRAKEAALLAAKKAELKQTIEDFLEQNKEKYLVISKSQDCWLLAKAISVNVFIKIDQSYFQPFEKHEDRNYMIVFIVKTAEEFKGDEITNKFLSRGCQVLKISYSEEVEKKFNSVQ